MNGGFERVSLIFLAGAVLIGVGIAMFRGVPNTPAPEAASASTALKRAGGWMDVSAPLWPGDYDLAAVAAGAPVPRAAAAETVIAAAIGAAALDAGQARDEFVRRALPLALLVNEEVLSERARLWEVRHKLSMGEPPSANEQLWLTMTAERYRVAEQNLAELALRLDAVPPSFILASVGNERRWRVGTSLGSSGSGSASSGSSGPETGSAGTSRSQGSSLAATQRGSQEAPAASLDEAIRSKVYAFNTASQFGAFREARERLRREGAPLEGAALIQTLPSARAAAWPGSDIVRSVISAEHLDRFDAARLQPAAGPV